jgi:hypothetical protein
MSNQRWLHGILDSFDERDVLEWIRKSTREEKRAFVDRIVFDLLDDNARSGRLPLLC